MRRVFVIVALSIVVPWAVAPTRTAASAPRDRLLASGQGFGYRGNAGQRADGNGDDGDLIRGRALHYDDDQRAWPPATAADNTVIDQQTGLMWVRDILRLDGGGGLGANEAFNRPMTWPEALARTTALDYAGHDDWRLPNVRELSTLVDFGRFGPTLDPEAFPVDNTRPAGPYFWSATTNPAKPFETYYVNFLDGHFYPYSKAMLFMARPVRDAAVAEPVALIQTGQTVGYGPDGRPEPGHGDDGDLRRGLAPEYRWSDDGQVDTAAENVAVDVHTDLAWLRDPLRLDGGGGVGGNVDLHAPLDWQAAVTACNALDYAGRDDWRLPNIRELESITLPGRPGSPVDPAAFPGSPVSPDPDQPYAWWSSTTAAMPRPGQPAGGLAWYLTTAAPVMRHVVAEGFVPAKTRRNYVRCVHDTTPPIRPALYAPEIRSSADFSDLTIEPAGRPGEREGKFLLALPTTADAPFEAAFQDVNAHPLHYDFLRAAFPHAFAGLTPEDYTALVARRATRRYVAGGLRRFAGAGGESVYGFDLYVAAGEAEELLTVEETRAVYRQLAQAFRRRPFAYAPVSPEAVALARSWDNPGFPVAYPAAPAPVDYEAYTPGVTYGTVRLLRLADLAGLVAAGHLGRQDLVVLDRAPTDLDVMVAGIVTGDRQGELSHLNVRSARRGTPNAYVREPHAAFAPYADQVVRLTVARDGYVVNEQVDPAEAAAWWAARRPRPVTVTAPDTAFDGLPGLTGPAELTGVARVGGKAANLARLYDFLPGRYQVPGLAIPFRDYLAFATATEMTAVGAPAPGRRTLAAQVAALAADARMAGDAAYRAARLAELRAAFEDEGTIPPGRVLAIAERVQAVFGPNVMVRFRSSSNAEDDLRFNGAGLYDSTSVCAADSLDGDAAGPSRCDPKQPKERTIERGLRRVWASLWNQRAWEERDWYGIAPTAVAMAVLVTTAFPDERANGVAFTGLPTDPGRPAYLVNAQDGDTSVVLPDPGVLPERVVLDMAGGQVTGIRRLQASSLVAPGTVVLSDQELEELGAVLALADAHFPLSLGDVPRASVLLDIEFKVRRADNQLLLKQIRPFLAIEPEAPRPGPALRLEVPGALAMCSLWRMAYPIDREHAEQVTLALTAGDLDIPLDRALSEHTLFGDLRYGPEEVLAVPTGPTRADIRADPGWPGTLWLDVTRTYRVADRQLEAHLGFAGLPADGFSVRLLNADHLTAGDYPVTVRPLGDDAAAQTMGPCGLGVLPPRRLRLDLAGGQSMTLHQRFGRGFFSYQWADLVAADVRLAAGGQRVTDLSRLTYDALRHNWNEQYLVGLDPPIGAAHHVLVTHDGTLPDEGPYTVTLLDATRAPLGTVPVLAARLDPGAAPKPPVLLPWARRR